MEVGGRKDLEVGGRKDLEVGGRAGKPPNRGGRGREGERGRGGETSGRQRSYSVSHR